MNIIDTMRTYNTRPDGIIRNLSLKIVEEGGEYSLMIGLKGFETSRLPISEDLALVLRAKGIKMEKCNKPVVKSEKTVKAKLENIEDKVIRYNFNRT